MLLRELVEQALPAVSAASRPTYATGLRLLARRLGDRDLEHVTLADLVTLRDAVRHASGVHIVTSARARGRRLRSYDPDAHGKGAAENFVRATRFCFSYAVSLGFLPVSPAERLKAPRRPQPPERPLLEHELADIWTTATTTGDDPELDGLLLMFLRHTAARREGCLNLCLCHLDPTRGRVTLSEKNGETREVPLAARLAEGLLTHARNRTAALDSDTVFRYRDGTPLTRRRFNSLFDRIDRHLGWTEPLDVGAHWIRHTTLADIAAVSGVRVAEAYAGHQPASLGVIGIYTKPTFADLEAAYAAVFAPR